MKNIGHQKAAVYIRMPSDFKSWLQGQAEQNHRTLQGEIMLRLERSRDHDQERARQEEAA